MNWAQEDGVRGEGVLGAQLSANHGFVLADLVRIREKGCEQRWGVWENVML